MTRHEQLLRRIILGGIALASLSAADPTGSVEDRLGALERKLAWMDDISLSVGGYVQLDAIADSTRIRSPNAFVTNDIPVQGEADYGSAPRFTMHAKQSRLSLDLSRPSGLGPVRVFYENDFYGDYHGPGMNYRLRHLFVSCGPVLFGQTWSAFYDPDACPDTLDFQGPGALGCFRQPQFRCQGDITAANRWTISLEQPSSNDVIMPAGAHSRSLAPDLIANWYLRQPTWHLSTALLGRGLAYETDTGPSGAAMGWGANLAGAAQVGSLDEVTVLIVGGRGIGRYMQDLDGNAASVSSDGEVHPLAAVGLALSDTHRWNESWRSTFTYGQVRLAPRDEQGDGAYHHTHYASTNLVWAFSRGWTAGVEGIYGIKTVASGEQGTDFRLQGMLRYRFGP